MLEKCQNYAFCLCSFGMSIVESLRVLSLCVFKTVRLLNRSWFILEWSHTFRACSHGGGGPQVGEVPQLPVVKES